jgi:hypothetical protein
MDGHLLAIVTPNARETTVPTFEPTNIKPLADLIEREILDNPGFSGVAQNSNVEIPSVSELSVRLSRRTHSDTAGTVKVL